ncbi:acylneuraminate cytidylyltransferase [Pedobacter quisquiliarum]|jgi:lysophospholipase L1-like esterase|uniref:Acylneuraminate cytidylyltransferase n=1 Tax=Pedobacter quisquiliarum TaxID=1834438 RepID=A0A916U9Y9_9SPHI|nr:SGNH/GDSL hydrolase family protein [Pedobacter quisquiliarum]GGC65219.1 acylneuraminate cytidylyltransferase [Pedobacter quisquiliarum]
MKPSRILIFVLIFMAVQTAQAQQNDDWPNLKKYREANAKLSAPAANEQRVVFMGNSITEGWINQRPEFFNGRPYINRGIGGQTTPQMLIRFRADVVALKPKVVVLLCGINDIAGNTGPSTLEMIEDNIASMTEIALANNIKVVLSSVLPAYDFPWRPNMEPAPKVMALNKWIKAYAAQKKVVYLDYFSAMVDERNGMKSIYHTDEVHPNKAGYAVMEPLVEQAIKKALKQ